MESSGSRIALTKRDKELLETLLQKVRYLSLAQIARTWWPAPKAPERNARTRLRELENGGFVHRFSVVVHSELIPDGPLFRWAPEREPPDFGALAHLLADRWPENYAPMPAIIATEQAARLLGGTGGRFPRATEETHDLHLSSVYLLFRSEDRLRARGVQKLAIAARVVTAPVSLTMTETK